ncbi:hypothetical protein G3N95_29935 [Paraburkholderia sp. Tr-20389]|uniref:hypothetical protein n=1 Tax=Paraburkholderia sp. Tr-20389 TaxID=2703903 RepID=UPI00197D8183|nr:hypothetical protein [Paraburkholderia sp. Tr-20389]MBN3757195.1 hypothetical protein [Paraburkholderia sp. Tr-20389]
MSTQPKEPSSLLENITHREMINVMSDAGIFCSVDKFRRVLQWAQQRAFESIALADQAMTKIENHTEKAA